MDVKVVGAAGFELPYENQIKKRIVAPTVAPNIRAASNARQLRKTTGRLHVRIMHFPNIASGC